MALIAVQKPTLAGTTFTKAAATNGTDTFVNTGVEYFHITNAHAVNPRTVTFDAPGGCQFEFTANSIHDNAVIVPALTTKIIGPFPTGRFNDASNLVSVTYSDAAADLTVALQANA